MTPTAITMMIVAIVVVWGGLLASILFLRSKPEVDENELVDPDRARDDARLDHEYPPGDV